MVRRSVMAPTIPHACTPPVSHEDALHTGLWVGDCFIYNNSSWRLNYCVGGEVCRLHGRARLRAE